jgi:hypothetical protein
MRPDAEEGKLPANKGVLIRRNPAGAPQAPSSNRRTQRVTFCISSWKISVPRAMRVGVTHSANSCTRGRPGRQDQGFRQVCHPYPPNCDRSAASREPSTQKRQRTGALKNLAAIPPLASSTCAIRERMPGGDLDLFVAKFSPRGELCCSSYLAADELALEQTDAALQADPGDHSLLALKSRVLTKLGRDNVATEAARAAVGHPVAALGGQRRPGGCFGERLCGRTGPRP